MWKRVYDLSEVKTLYYSVTPELDRNEDLLKRFTDQYRAFCYYPNEGIRKLKPLAFVVICDLPMSKAIVIDLFAIEGRIRKKGYARQIFWSLIVQLPILWPEIKEYYNRWILEAYLHNINPWCKIMNMSPVEIDIKPMYLNNPIKLLQHDVDNVEDAYKEWQEFQQKWQPTESRAKL